MLLQAGGCSGVNIAEQADFQRDSLIKHILSQSAQFDCLTVEYGDVIDEPGSVSNTMRAAVLNRLPDRFLAVALPGMNRDVEIFALDVVKGVHVLLRRVATFLPCQVESDHTTLPKVDCKFRHLKRCIHIAHGTDNQA